MSEDEKPTKSVETVLETTAVDLPVPPAPSAASPDVPAGGGTTSPAPASVTVEQPAAEDPVPAPATTTAVSSAPSLPPAPDSVRDEVDWGAVKAAILEDVLRTRECASLVARMDKQCAAVERPVPGDAETTPSSQGFQLDDGADVSEVWFIGDVHGDLLGLEAALHGIRARSRDGVVVFLGDLIDDGSHQSAVVLRVWNLMLEDPTRHRMIAGNHDAALAHHAESGRFDSRVQPASFAPWLNSEIEAGGDRAATASALGMTFIEFVRGLPRAILFDRCLLASHAGVPHSDLWDHLGTIADLSDRNVQSDFLWNRWADTARKFPNRHSHGSEFGSEDFGDFRTKVAPKLFGQPFESMVRGHDHVESRRARWERKGKVRRGDWGERVLTINTMSYNLRERRGLEAEPRYTTVARWRKGEAYPTPVEIEIPAELLDWYAPSCPACGFRNAFDATVCAGPDKRNPSGRCDSPTPDHPDRGILTPAAEPTAETPPAIENAATASDKAEPDSSLVVPLLEEVPSPEEHSLVEPRLAGSNPVVTLTDEVSPTADTPSVEAARIDSPSRDESTPQGGARRTVGSGPFSSRKSWFVPMVIAAVPAFGIGWLAGASRTRVIEDGPQARSAVTSTVRRKEPVPAPRAASPKAAAPSSSAPPTAGPPVAALPAAPVDGPAPAMAAGAADLPPEPRDESDRVLPGPEQLATTRDEPSRVSDAVVAEALPQDQPDSSGSASARQGAPPSDPLPPPPPQPASLGDEATTPKSVVAPKVAQIPTAKRIPKAPPAATTSSSHATQRKGSVTRP